MEHQEMDTLTQRLDRLEQESRRWKVLVITAVAILGLTVLTAATGYTVAEETIRTMGSSIVDYDPTGGVDN